MHESTTVMKLPKGGQPQITELRAYAPEIVLEHMLSKCHSNSHGVKEPLMRLCDKSHFIWAPCKFVSDSLL